jgi:hypothetical protein
MKTNATTSETILSNTFGRSLGRLCRAGAAALALLGGASTALAETHAIIPTNPATVVSGTTKAVAVDSAYHFIYTVNGSQQVQVTFVDNNKWVTAPLGVGQPVKADSKLYTDSSYHYLYYVGANNRLWVWYVNNGAWANGQLHPTEVATDLVGVDSSLHYLWFRNAGQLRVLYFNGSAWAALPSGVTDYDGPWGGAVDEVSHGVYWNDATALSLRGLFFTGRAYLERTLDTNVFGGARPAVHQGTGEIYSVDNSLRALFRELPNFSFLRQNVSISGGSDATQGNATLAVNPVTGKVIYGNAVAPPGGVTVLTPSGPGPGTIWTRSSVTGTNTHAVIYCALDNVYGWYFYTGSDNTLHIVF